ncbi:DUF6301 family protein [Nocardia sp. NPDC052566]|uniref:DUF6301 family protein n=1 Tax=Nocardia sp. NPDC052566 TaxID=3364330 RepID=UPI0037CA53B0
MHADTEGAIRIARLAAQFNWTGTIDDVEPFCATAGWEILHEEGKIPVIQTNLTVNRPLATIHQRKQRMDYLSIYVTDVAPLDLIPLEVEPEMRAHFTDLSRALTEILGAPTRHDIDIDVDETLRWDLPKIVIQLVRSLRAVYIDLVGREHQAELDEPEPEDED